MDIFVDEAGLFTSTHGWSVVCALCLPSREVGPARRRIAYISREWPRSPNGEIKGGSLSFEQISILVEELYARDAVLYCVVIDVASESEEHLLHHKQMQCEGITAHITDDHSTEVSGKLWDLRRTLETMPMQLYIQSVSMSTLGKDVVEGTTSYFSQRRPRGIGSYHWTIDAKDPLRITTQEEWWRDTLGPLLESGCLRDPLEMVRDRDFDYNHFDKSFLFQKQLWRPDRERELIAGYDIGKIVSKNVDFEVSHSDILLQAVDTAANVVRRILNGDINNASTAQVIGKLQITRKRGTLYQSVHAISLSHERDSKQLSVGKMLGIMSRAGRSMIRQGSRAKRS